MIEKLKNLDRRYIFLFVLVAVILPLIKPLGLPIKTSKPVEDIYNAMEALPAGSVILMSFDYSPSTATELSPAVEALVKHAFKKDIKIVAIALWPDGQTVGTGILDRLGKEYHKKYGVDYVNLGYKAGGTSLLLAMKAGFAQTFPRDCYSNKVETLPLMRKVKDYSNIAIAFSFSGGVPGIKEYIATVNTQFGVKTSGAVTGVTAPELYTFLNSGQLTGLMGGLKGAAEYEKLVGFPGLASISMDAQSVVHLVIVLFIILANVIYFSEEFHKRN